MTDAISAMGLPPGQHHLGNMAVTISEQHRVTLTGTDTLAGRCAAVLFGCLYSRIDVRFCVQRCNHGPVRAPVRRRRYACSPQ